MGEGGEGGKGMLRRVRGLVQFPDPRLEDMEELICESLGRAPGLGLLAPHVWVGDLMEGRALLYCAPPHFRLL